MNILSVLAVSDETKPVLLCSFLQQQLTCFQNKVSVAPIQFHALCFSAEAAVQTPVLNTLFLLPVMLEPGAALSALQQNQQKH